MRETAVWSAQGQCRAVVSGAREDSAGTAGLLVVPGKVCSTACSTDSWLSQGVTDHTIQVMLVMLVMYCNAKVRPQKGLSAPERILIKLNHMIFGGLV